MTTAEIVYNLLATFTNASTRVYPVAAPKDATRPYIVFHEIAGGSNHVAAGSRDIAMTRVQVTCIADTFGAADTLMDQVRTKIDGWRGTINSEQVLHCLMIDGSRRDLPFIAPENEQATRFGRMCDFNIFHEQDLPSLASGGLVQPVS